MEYDEIIHRVIVDTLMRRLSREYMEVRVSPDGNPDLTLLNHGVVLAVVEVEADKDITPERAERWKLLAQEGTKVIVMVPKHAKMKAIELLWQKGIVERVSIGSFEITISMP